MAEIATLSELFEQYPEPTLEFAAKYAELLNNRLNEARERSGYPLSTKTRIPTSLAPFLGYLPAYERGLLHFSIHLSGVSEFRKEDLLQFNEAFSKSLEDAESGFLYWAELFQKKSEDGAKLTPLWAEVNWAVTRYNGFVYTVSVQYATAFHE